MSLLEFIILVILVSIALTLFVLLDKVNELIRLKRGTLNRQDNRNMDNLVVTLNSINKNILLLIGCLGDKKKKE